MSSRIALAGLVFALCGAAPMAQELAFERFVLPNGMVVILHQDHTLPLVVVNLWYGVGSKDEPDGRTGFAHLFEHLMFMGTDRVPEGEFDAIMEAAGGSNNASTSEDRTNYYSSGPRNLLPTLLWLEADRLESLGRAMTEEKLELQRDVVRNERRQSYENQPYGKSWLALPEMLYPPMHPYAHPVIGSHEDLEAASVEDVKEFFATFYVPNNASLVVAGDFDPAEAKALIESLFASLPRKPDPPRQHAATTRARSAQKSLTDEVPAPRVTFAWVSPPHFKDGDAELDLLADILADGASSRLERALVREQRLAQDVSARQDSGELNSVFYVSATALPGVPLEKVEAAIDAELARVLKEGVSAAEVERVANKEEADFARGMQDLLRRADQLNMYQCVLGDPGKLQWDLARYRKATAESVKRWAERVLDLESRTVLRVVPEAAAPRASSASARDQRPAIGEAPAWTPAPPKVSKLSGGDGPDLWLIERHQAPLVAFQMVIGLGAVSEPRGQEGVTALLADLMKEGAGARDGVELAAALDKLGSEIRVEAGRFATTIAGSCLSRHLDATLDILADIVLRPRLEETDFTRRKALRLADLEQRNVDPSQVAAVVSQRALRERLGVPGHPISGWTRSVAQLENGMVRERWKALLANAPYAKFVVAGDADEAALREKLAARFGSLRKAPLVVPDFRTRGGGKKGLAIYLVDRPGAPQTVIRFHRDAEPLGSSRTPALWLANTAFGGSFTSRLNLNLREEHGFTYGASSRFIQGETEGSFIAGASVKTEVTGDALEQFLVEFERLGKKDFEQDELEKALATERTELIKEFETVSETADRIGQIAEANLTPDSFTRIFAALGQVTLQQIADTAADALAPEGAVLVLVGDRERILSQLREWDDLGPVIVVDAEGNPLPAAATTPR